ncbi:MAG: pilus assembly protein [Acidobacteriota bacterium]|nr:pilus assembly protein [Acidobacteriota bacterium]
MNMRTRLFAIRLVRRLCDDAGAQLVEFAISIVVLIMLMFGVFAFCLAMYSYHFVSYVAQEGARFAMVRGSDWKTSCATSAPPNFTVPYSCKAASVDVQNYVRSLAMPGINPSNISVTTTWPGTTPSCTSNCSVCSTVASSGCYVKVQVSYPFLFNVPFARQSTYNFTGTSEKVIQY